jgi:vacuolar-type H+-ATPase subunit H
MNKASENPEFMRTIEDIRGAEAEYDTIISQGKEKAERVLRDSKEKVHKEREKTQEQITSYKNDKTRAGSKGIEAEVEKMVKKAKSEASAMGRKKLAKPEISQLVKKFLNSL